MKVNLEFLGAFNTVTGSKTLLTMKNKNYLVDCGLFQGPKELRAQNREDLKIQASTIQAVFLTHAHLDHCGYLPRLYKAGFRGPIYCSKGTAQLAEVILKDAAFLEEELASYARHTGYSRHQDPEPLYRVKDVEHMLPLFRPISRHAWHQVDEHLSVRLLRAGHIVGASFVQLHFSDEVNSKTITFSGDLGNQRSQILKGPEPIEETDVLILESTYGNRLHASESPQSLLAKSLKPALERGGVAVIPAFAVGRSQEVIHLIARLEQAGEIPKVPVILDSPMAKKALEIFLDREDDQSVLSSFRGTRDTFFPANFRATDSADESMVACMMDGPAIIISASGMLSGGRVLHHLKRRLPDPRNLVIFTGYQAIGSKGRFLQDMASGSGTLRIHHQEVPVAAEMVSIESLSCHADYQETIAWLKSGHLRPTQVILNHGEGGAQEHLASAIREQLGWQVTPSNAQQIWNLD